jgi:hypothetical protein
LNPQKVAKLTEPDRKWLLFFKLLQLTLLRVQHNFHVVKRLKDVVKSPYHVFADRNQSKADSLRAFLLGHERLQAFE